ncbi:MAG: carbon starvation CstA family protein [Polyangiaceae bacterium]
MASTTDKLHPTNKLGAVRSSFCGDHRRGPPDWSRAGGSVRLSTRAIFRSCSASCWRARLHDFVILVSSTRRGGRSLAEIAHDELGPMLHRHGQSQFCASSSSHRRASETSSSAALSESAWGIFTVSASIQFALMGFYIYGVRKVSTTASTKRRGQCLLLLLALIGGKELADSSDADAFRSRTPT